MAAAPPTSSWPWLFEPRPYNSDQLKEAHSELIQDEADLADIDFSTDDFSVSVNGCIAFIAGKVINEASEVAEAIAINFKDKTVKLPNFVSTLHSVEGQIKASDIRYVGVVSGEKEGVSCDDLVVLISIWIAPDSEIVNIYLKVPSRRESLILANSISKVLFEACSKSAIRSNKFNLVCSGYVLLSLCSVDERDDREKMVAENAKNQSVTKNDDAVTSGNLEADAVEKAKDDTHEMPQPLEEVKMFFMLDEEALCLYEHPLSPKPVRDFRFYKESLPRAIDMIYICNQTEQLEIQQQQNVFFMRPLTGGETAKDENFKALSDLLKTGSMKPKPQEIFSSLEKFVQFYAETQPKLTKPAATLVPVKPVAQVQQPSATQGSKHPSNEQWLTLLLTGSHLENSDEEMQMMWFGIEDDISKCIKENCIPDPTIASSGINPESTEQLLTTIEDVKDKLLTKELPIAISRLRGVRSAFKETLLRSVAQLDEVELLKRIYFLSG